MSACPFCGNNLKVHLAKGTPTKKRQKKDPNEPMTATEFIEGCWNNKQRHIQIIGHYADELKLNGKYNTRGQWGRFLEKNVKVARKMADFDDDQIRESMKLVLGDLKSNGGFMDYYKLETVFNRMVK